jgi:acyl-coenzyme A thioesterase PaaI-like protein
VTGTADPGPGELWTFGLEPPAQALEVAPLLRRIAGLVLALEGPEPAVDRLVEQLRAAEQELTALAPTGPAPRVGEDPPADARPYVDHGRDIGAYNPCFPEYLLEVRGVHAVGTVTFPVAFEGPPGIVHGGVQANFFDCVIQHHNCEYGQAGRTVSLELRYRRPVPVGVPLAFTVERVADERRITSTAQLLLGDEVLTTAVMSAVAGDRANLPLVWPRRPS